MTTTAVDLTFSFWNDDRDFVNKAKELSEILSDMKTGKEEARNIFREGNIIVNEQLLNLAFRINEGE